MKQIKLELCCGSAEDVYEGYQAGIRRVELNSSLFLGGLTPTAGTVRVARALAPEMEIMAMVRPREGGFCYTEVEMRVALADAKAVLEAGADGIVFGFLKEDGTVDRERCKRMIDAAGGKPTVFHRAIDVTPDWKAALEILMELGITRVLTSGQAPSVLFGLETVRQMREFAKGQIEILPGAGIKRHNAEQVLAATGCDQLHLSGHKVVCDPSTQGNPDIHFGGALYPSETQYKVADTAYLTRLCEENAAR